MQLSDPLILLCVFHAWHLIYLNKNKINHLLLFLAEKQGFWIVVVEGKEWRINCPWIQREHVFLLPSNLLHPSTTPLLKSFIAYKSFQSFHLFHKEILHQVLGKALKGTVPVINIPHNPCPQSKSILTSLMMVPNNYVSQLFFVLPVPYCFSVSWGKVGRRRVSSEGKRGQVIS